ncbi:MAG: FAD-dependent oxidoreductase [Nitrospirales bacterium]
MTRPIWIIGGTLAGLITAFRLLPYGFHLRILERRTAPQIPDQTDALPPVWPGFFHATWSLLQELSLPLTPFQTGSIEILSTDNQRYRISRLPFFSHFHVFPELLLFKGLSWRDRLNLLNHLEKSWEQGRSDEGISDTQSAENWVTDARQSHAARQCFWNPLCRWLLGCDLSDASLRMFVTSLSRYAQTTSTGTQWFFGSESHMGELKTALRDLLIKQGVQFHTCEEYPLFRSVGRNSENLLPAGDSFSETATYVAALPPEEILSLLPERVLTKFAQLDQMAHIASHTRLLMTFTVPNIELPPSLVLCPHHIDWVAILPPTGSLPTGTQMACLLQEMPDEFPSERHTQIKSPWAYLQAILHVARNLPDTACPPQFQYRQLRLFPSSAGLRAFRPRNSGPIPNFFVVGTWTETTFPHSMESLVNSANTCAEAIAHRFFACLR